jgi:hypothetical protein
MMPAQRWDDDMMDMDSDRWLVYGIEQGFCGPAVCTTHDGIPYTSEEDEVWGEGGDPCVHMMRPYTDAAQKQEVEENHPPSTWRKPRWRRPL